MTYEIKSNPEFNSLEVYFDGKPSEAVRTALKGLKFRWHSVKKCWYGYAAEETVAAAIIGAGSEEEQDAPYVVGDGYLGGGAVYGPKSGQNLYGSDLSQAIRQDIKKAGIKGVTVSCKSYSGGQNITATVKLSEADFISEDEFVQGYEVKPSCFWIWTGEENVHVDKYYSLPGEEQAKIRESAARAEYEKFRHHKQDLNQYRIDDYRAFSAACAAKLHAVAQLIQNYRYDCSNAMVDYFDTNFYYDIRTNPVNA